MNRAPAFETYSPACPASSPALSIEAGDPPAVLPCAGIRRGKLAASLEQFVAQVMTAAEHLVEAMAREEPEAGQQSEYVAVSVPQNVPMPRCILSNTEPYLHGDWRREPYLPRCAPAAPHGGTHCAAGCCALAS